MSAIPSTLPTSHKSLDVSARQRRAPQRVRIKKSQRVGALMFDETESKASLQPVLSAHDQGPVF
jgi:hypothetical protein